MNRKYFYYVGVYTDNSELRYVTRTDNASKPWVYDVTEAPLAFSKSDAERLVETLTLNFVRAVLIKSPMEITSHPGVTTDSAEKCTVEPDVFYLNSEPGKLKYWSNGCGELHHHGEYEITEKELPKELLRAYKDLFSEGQFAMTCYLAEYDNKYGITLESVYDTDYAKFLGISYASLVSMARERAVELAKAVPGYTVLFGFDTLEWSDGSKDSQLILFLPWDISEEEYTRVGKLADSIVCSFSSELV